jgi:indole-3-glycerol phosphate synthase
MDVLVEVHDEAELTRALKINPEFIGINNRNLKTFEVDLTVTQRLSALIPEDILCISESGIRTQQDIACILGFGVSCFLVGESFMRCENPGQELENLFSLKNANR